MDEVRARVLLGNRLKRDKLDFTGRRSHVKLSAGGEFVDLSGFYNADELEAMAWWLRNKTEVTTD